jgi:hypothetical protein
MSNNIQRKQAISQCIQAFANLPLRKAALSLFAALGYESDRTVETPSVVDFRAHFDPEFRLEHPAALIESWQSAELLFQLTDEELSRSAALFKDEAVKTSLLQSYVFIAIELTEGDYARGKLAGIARRINYIFPMPVMVLFKIGGRLSIAVINRRLNKRDDSKDVLGKVTLIQNIAIDKPHPGHLDILASFSLAELTEGRRVIQNFDQLHAAWEEVFNVELLNKRFYEELSNWYFWARHQVSFPGDLESDERIRNATSVIRLLTRLIFCWFLKEKRLIPDHLFDQQVLAGMLNSLAEDESTYYHAILQNLFFATLNQPMNAGDAPHRKFAVEGSFQENREQHGVKNLYRYAGLFREPEGALSLFENIPFLNGGLFACLDVEDDTGKVQYADGFSRNPKKQPCVPNRLFFAETQTVDLSGRDDFGDPKKKKAKVRGLLHILNGYKFTIAESTPVEQEIALDPELLGNVFENLLASYNPETGESARRQTGSFYTPRPIVDYMVDGTLKAYLADALCQRLPVTSKADAKAGLDILFAYTEKTHAFTEAECDALIAAIDACNILDPACGSGAYPMGILHKLVFVLGKLDPHNEKWRQRQISKAEEIEDVEARASAIVAINNDFANNALDYGRKLYLIENCIYGVDIQPIAIQIAKLRFFISLICDQKTNGDRSKNLGVRPLPNLETKFVTADSLLTLDAANTSISLTNTPEVQQLKRELSKVRHRYFSATSRDEKKKLRAQDEKLRKNILDLLTAMGYGSEEERRRVDWNPYDPHGEADFFDPSTMFPELEQGFDIVIGNPPYVQIQKFSAAHKQAWQTQNYSTYVATGDVYCLFYERGTRLLKQGGQLSYITSNKWMRAGYGEKLRGLFIQKVVIEEVIDFGGVVVFNAAMVDTAIVRLGKRQPSESFPSAVLTRNFSLQQSLADYMQNNAVPFKRPANGADSWVVMSPDRYRIKQAVEVQGVPLERWHIQINYGIKTGYNEAFYISAEQRDALTAEDQRCADLIVPLLRGRDIQRYGTDWLLLDDEKWMINTHNGIKEQGILPIDVQHDYPSLWQHLLRYRKNLEPRLDQGDHWSNLRNCAYLDEFKKPKIIYPEITKYINFYFDDASGFYPNNKAFILTAESESLYYLVAVLNSSLFRCCFMDNFPNLGEDRRELRKIFMDKVPIKKPDEQQANLFEGLVPMVQAAKAQAQTSDDQVFSLAADFLIEIIDACVMEVYFAQHMAEKQLAITTQARLLLPENIIAMTQPQLAEAAVIFYRTANGSQHPIRNILLRIPADSPDLLAVIQREGKV